MHLPIDIVAYTGGSCGEMVTAVIDPTGYHFNGRYLELLKYDRSKLKNREWDFSLSNIDRDNAINELALKYRSLPSHKLDYHAFRKHDVIFIDATQPGMEEWVFNRINDIHSGKHKQWLNLEKDKESYINNFYPSQQFLLPIAKRIIKLRDILEGKLIDVLKTYVATPLNEALYYTWLDQTLKHYPLKLSVRKV